MDLFKAYALCTNSYNIVISPNKANNKKSNNFNCEIFSSLEEVNKNILKKVPIDFYIIEVYGNNFKQLSKKIKIKLTTNY
jgi:uncharacterized alkaline shock family protein YloU